jgi:hypothetical protein
MIIMITMMVMMMEIMKIIISVMKKVGLMNKLVESFIAMMEKLVISSGVGIPNVISIQTERIVKMILVVSKKMNKTITVVVIISTNIRSAKLTDKFMKSGRTVMETGILGRRVKAVAEAKKKIRKNLKELVEKINIGVLQADSAKSMSWNKPKSMMKYIAVNSVITHVLVG